MKITFLRKVLDHAERCFKSLRGFGYLGLGWTRPWLTYLFQPFFYRFGRNQVLDFHFFWVRSREKDIDVFANIFADYDSALLRKALAGVEQVIDAGANVGAFSFLTLRCVSGHAQKPKIIALEPAEENYHFLLQQPFAVDLDCRLAALGAEAGSARLVCGSNSVNHQVDYEAREGGNIAVLGLSELCDRPTLLKMDIEGAELEILKKGLPVQVKSLFLEWHPYFHHSAQLPPDFIPEGKWTCLNRDMYGSTCWFWSRH